MWWVKENRIMKNLLATFQQINNSFMSHLTSWNLHALWKKPTIPISIFIPKKQFHSSSNIDSCTNPWLSGYITPTSKNIKKKKHNPRLYIYIKKIVNELSKLCCGFILWLDFYISRWWQPTRQKKRNDDLKNINVIRRNGLLRLKRNKGEP